REKGAYGLGGWLVLRGVLFRSCVAVRDDITEPPAQLFVGSSRQVAADFQVVCQLHRPSPSCSTREQGWAGLGWGRPTPRPNHPRSEERRVGKRRRSRGVQERGE